MNHLFVIIWGLQPWISEFSVYIAYCKFLLYFFLKLPQLFFDVPVYIGKATLWVVEVQSSTLVVCERRNHLRVITLFLRYWVSSKTVRALSLWILLRLILLALYCWIVFLFLWAHLIAGVVRLVNYANGVKALDILYFKIADTRVTLFIFMFKQYFVDFLVLLIMNLSRWLTLLLHIQECMLGDRGRLRSFSLVGVFDDLLEHFLFLLVIDPLELVVLNSVHCLPLIVGCIWQNDRIKLTISLDRGCIQRH